MAGWCPCGRPSSDRDRVSRSSAACSPRWCSPRSSPRWATTSPGPSPRWSSWCRSSRRRSSAGGSRPSSWPGSRRSRSASRCQPLGSPQVRLSEDVLALVVFSAVAFVVSALVTTRVTALEKVDDQRRAMLRSVSHDLRTPLAAIHAVATDLHAGADYDQHTRDEVLDVLDRRNRASRSTRCEPPEHEPHRSRDDATAPGGGRRRGPRRRERTPAGTPLHALEARGRRPRRPAVGTGRSRRSSSRCATTCSRTSVQHTPEGTCVRIAARARGDTVEITVADNGPGLPPDIAARCARRRSTAVPGSGSRSARQS